ncbi:MAG TPA: histidine kinase [Prolixibacteraceae bacterium]|nr:histidine kinase [Prolixibacteraceae bacterium]
MWKNKLKVGNDELFNDRWIMVIGCLVTGTVFPIIFGMRPTDPKFFPWIFASVAMTFLFWGTSRQFGVLLWKKYPWDKNPLIHIVSVLAYIIIFTVAIIFFIYLINLFSNGNMDNYWQAHKGFHMAILFVFIFSVTVHEAIYLFFLWKRELTRSADLEKENIRSKFEALKNHVNPHFLFNSLGTLSSLINTDQEKATRYVNEFSKIYRYFLEVNSNDLVTIEEETEFIHSYIFLQQIRYGEGFSFENRIGPRYSKTYILPLSLQLLIENALKHNTTVPGSPLKIEIYVDEEKQSIVVKNNLQPRKVENTPKTGLKNLEQRYLNFTGKPIAYRKDDSFFIVEIPIISNEP